MKKKTQTRQKMVPCKHRRDDGPDRLIEREKGVAVFWLNRKGQQKREQSKEGKIRGGTATLLEKRGKEKGT